MFSSKNSLFSVLFVGTVCLLLISSVRSTSRQVLTSDNRAGEFSDLTLAYLDQLPQIVYQDIRDEQLKLIQCSNLDCSTWTTTVLSTMGGSQGQDAGDFCSIQSSSVNSKLYISSLWGPDYVARVWECVPEGVSCETAVINNSSLDVFVHAIPTQTTPEHHTAYIKSGDKTLYYQHLVDIHQTPDPERALIPRVTAKASVAMIVDDGFGFALIALYHPVYDNIWFVRCRSKSCSTWSTIQNVDQGTGTGKASNVGSHISMCHSDSQVYLAYYWVGSSALRAMYCPSVDGEYDKCQSFTVENPGEIQVGKYTSIAVNKKKNKFYITYYDETNGHLRVAACNLQLQCKVNAGDYGAGHVVGLYTSAAIDSLGLLSVVYLDDTTNSLKYLRRNFAQPYIGEEGTTAMAQTITGSPLIIPSTGSTAEEGWSIWTSSSTGGGSSSSSSNSTDLGSTSGTGSMPGGM